MAFTLGVAGSSKQSGLADRIDDLITGAVRSKAWPDASLFDASAYSKARAKVPWEEFEHVASRAATLAYALWDDRPEFSWHGMSVYGIDGSKYDLPATDAIREEFDPHSGLDVPGRGHYPQCTVLDAFDVFRRLPVARTLMPHGSSERELAVSILPKIPPGGMVVYDQGFPGFEFFTDHIANYNGFFMVRCPYDMAFSQLRDFALSDADEAVLSVDPSRSYLQSLCPQERRGVAPITLRVVKLRSSCDGSWSLLITNLLDPAITADHLRQLYRRRWRVEVHYRDEKVSLRVETFHSRTPNGIRQELFAIMAISIIARTLMMLTALKNPRIQPRFKTAAMILAREIPALIADDPATALALLSLIINRIARIKHHTPPVPRKPYPRICKRPPSKWILNRAKEIAKAN